MNAASQLRRLQVAFCLFAMVLAPIPLHPQRRPAPKVQPGAKTTAKAAPSAAPPAGMNGCPAPPSAFGSKEKLLVGLEGKIYFLAPGTRKLPDFEAMES